MACDRRKKVLSRVDVGFIGCGRSVDIGRENGILVCATVDIELKKGFCIHLWVIVAFEVNSKCMYGIPDACHS